MKLIGRLKKQVDSTTDMSEKRRFIEKAGLKLTDDELSMVAGGLRDPDPYFRPGGGNTGGGNTGGGNTGGGNTGGGNTGEGKVGEYGLYNCDKGHSFLFDGGAPSKCPTCQSTVLYKV